MKKIPNWIFVDSRTGEIYCARCSEREKATFPVSVTAFLKQNKKFGQRHKDCKEKKAE
jgi:hypothetical protein